VFETFLRLMSMSLANKTINLAKSRAMEPFEARYGHGFVGLGCLWPGLSIHRHGGRFFLLNGVRCLQGGGSH
jgi:hypothetical protein